MITPDLGLQTKNDKAKSKVREPAIAARDMEVLASIRPLGTKRSTVMAPGYVKVAKEVNTSWALRNITNTINNGSNKDMGGMKQPVDTTNQSHRPSVAQSSHSNTRPMDIQNLNLISHSFGPNIRKLPKGPDINLIH